MVINITCRPKSSAAQFSHSFKRKLSVDTFSSELIYELKIAWNSTFQLHANSATDSCHSKRPGSRLLSPLHVFHRVFPRDVRVVVDVTDRSEVTVQIEVAEQDPVQLVAGPEQNRSENDVENGA